MDNLDYNYDNFIFLVEENRKKDELIEGYREEIKSLNSQLALLKKYMFGKKSERLIDLPGAESPDMPGFELPEPESQVISTTLVPEHERKKVRRTDKKFTFSVSDDVPVKERIIDIPEEEKFDPITGEELIVIGHDTCDKLVYTAGSYHINRDIRPRYAKKSDPTFGVRQAKAPSSILEGSKLDASFMAHVVVDKYAYHLPLNRQLEKLSHAGITLTPQYMSSLIINLGNKVMPLVDLISQKIFEQGVIYTDGTPLKLQIKGKDQCKQGQMWIYVGGKPGEPAYQLYKFSPGKNHCYPAEHLKNFQGYMHADAFELYEKLDKDPTSGIIWVPCWAHARRNFFELGIESTIGTTIVKIMRNLFRYEKIAWKRDAAERLSIRQEKERPLVDNLFQYLHQLVKNSEILPKSSTGKAVIYILSREEQFRRYLENPDLRMENNISERGLRKVVLGRVNWLFVGSERAGNSAAALMTLVQTCRSMNIDPQEYLTDIFNRLLDHPAKRLDELLPDQWLNLKQQATDITQSNTG